MTSREEQEAIAQYEGLVKETAYMLVSGTHPDMRGRPPIEESREDVEQILRIKVLRAVRAWDPSRAKKKGARGHSPRDLYVYMCLRDQVKDIAKRRRRHDVFIEDLTGEDDNGSRDRFDGRYLAETADDAFAEVEDELPELPASLTEKERRVLLLMYQEHRQTEIARILQLSKREVESAVRQVRVKMAGWRPESLVASTA